MTKLALALALTLSAAQEPDKCGSCKKETYGTAVHWAGSVSEAARQAKEKEKLVLILHVSGHFEDAAFT